MISLYSKLRQVRSQQSLLNFEDTDFNCEPIDYDYENRSPTPVLKIIECSKKEKSPIQLRAEQCGTEQLIAKLRNWQGIHYTIGHDLTSSDEEEFVDEKYYSQCSCSTCRLSNYTKSNRSLINLTKCYSECPRILVQKLSKTNSQMKYYYCREFNEPARNFLTAKESYVPCCITPIEYRPDSLSDVSICCTSRSSCRRIKSNTGVARQRDRRFYITPDIYTHCGSLQYQQSLFQRCVLGGVKARM